MGQAGLSLVELSYVWCINVWRPGCVQVMLQEHGRQHPLLLHHRPGGVRGVLLLLLPHRSVPLRRGVCTSPAMF